MQVACDNYSYHFTWSSRLYFINTWYDLLFSDVAWREFLHVKNFRPPNTLVRFVFNRYLNITSRIWNEFEMYKTKGPLYGNYRPSLAKKYNRDSPSLPGIKIT